MARHARARASRASAGKHAAFVVLGLGVLASLFAWRAMEHRVSTETSERFAHDATENTSAIRHELQRRGDLLRAGRDSLGRGGWVPRREFSSFASAASRVGPDGYPDLRSLGYAAAVAGPALPGYLDWARAEGVGDVAVRPPGERPEYAIVTYSHAYSDSKSGDADSGLVGFDAATSDEARSATERARDSGEPVLSGPLPGRSPNRGDLTLFLAFYSGGATPAAVGERRRELTGWLVESLDGRRLLQDVYERHPNSAFTELFDGARTRDREVGAFPPHRGAATGGGGLRSTVSIDPYGRAMTVRVTAPEGYGGWFGTREPLGVLASGLVVSVLLFAIAWMLATSRARALRLVDEGTAALRDSEERFRRLDQIAFEGIAIHQGGKIRDANTAFVKMFGYDCPRDVVGRSPLDFMAPASGDEVSEGIHGGDEEPYEVEAVRADGTTFPGYVHVRLIPYEGTTARMTAIHDLTDRVKAERALSEARERFRAAFDDAPFGMAMVSLDAAEPGRILDANRALSDLTGFGEAEMLEISFPDLCHPEDRAGSVGILARMREGALQRYQGEKRCVRADGGVLWVRTNLSVISGPGDRPTCAVVHVDDVTAQRAAERTLVHRALHDPLTGLANRDLLLDRLQTGLARLHRRPGGVSVLFVDLDLFKDVNDRFGHQVGDEVLVELGRRIQAAIRPSDTAARLGGDEFVIVCEDGPRWEDFVGIAERVRSAIARPVSVAGAEATVSASIGIAVARDGGADAEALLRSADAAMYRAKREGRDRIELCETAVRFLSLPGDEITPQEPGVAADTRSDVPGRAPVKGGQASP